MTGNDPMQLRTVDERLITLAQLLGRPFDTTRFLRIATSVSKALEAHHDDAGAHCSLTPTAILVEPETFRVRLTAPADAPGLPSDSRSDFVPLAALAYIAPEQTGRLNRPVDARSDLYALGTVFYEMLTGRTPFTASSPLEWVRCHVAAQAVPPSEHTAGIPSALSLLVMRLLSKSADERYQSAAALHADLARADECWTINGYVPEIRLGGSRPSSKLQPKALHGRKRQLAQLGSALELVRAGGSAVAALAGQSGTGKTALAHEIRRRVIAEDGIFADGKFDQFRQGRPYSALGQAVNRIVATALESDVATRSRKAAEVLHCLGSSCHLLAGLADNLLLLIGNELPPAVAMDGQRRLHEALIRFLALFGSPGRPLALFLDDLQWADDGTLAFLEHVLDCGLPANVMLLLSYRDDEIGHDHVLSARRLSAGRASGGSAIHRLELAPLRADAVRTLVEDVLGRTDVPEAMLTSVGTGSSGNPLHILQLLGAAADAGLLHHQAQPHWSFDPATFEPGPRGLDELVRQRIRALPAETGSALAHLACLGNGFDDQVLATAAGMPKAALRDCLGPALEAGLIGISNDRIAFSHDRVQQAAFEQVEDAARVPMELTAGSRLIEGTLPEQVDERLFAMLGLMNRVPARMLGPHRIRVAELNVRASGRARQSAAYASALAYLERAELLLGEEGWSEQPRLAFEIALQACECTFLRGSLDEANRRLERLSARGISADQANDVVILRVKVLTGMDRNDQAVELGLNHLRERGLRLPGRPGHQAVADAYAAMLQALGDRPIEELQSLPLLADPALRHLVDLLSELTAAASYVDENLLGLILLTIAQLSIANGNAPGSCFAYVCLNMVVAFRFGDYDAGHRFGAVALRLVERPDLGSLKPRVLMCFGAMVSPWSHHIGAGRPLIEQAFTIAVRNGDMVFAAYARDMLVTNRAECGEVLETVEREATAALDFARNAGIGLVVAFLQSQRARIRSLRGATPSFGYFEDGNFSEASYERRLEADAGLVMAAFRYWTQKLELRFHADLLDDAEIAAERAGSLLWTSPSFFETANFRLFDGLLAARLLRNSVGAGRDDLRLRLGQAVDVYTIWARHSSSNFAARASLLAAELARADGRWEQAEQLYESALDAAAESGFPQIEGLVAEHAASFHLDRGLGRIAATYARVAHDSYERWGATAKVDQIAARHPDLRSRPQVPTDTEAGLDNLDHAAIVSALQTLATEMDSRVLIHRLLEVTLASAGADRGVLLLVRDGAFREIAIAETVGQEVTVSLDVGEAGREHCEAAVALVRTSGRPLILDRPGDDERFSGDTFVQSRKPRSLLVLPLIRQGDLTGALQLENNQVEGAFTPRHITLLELLAAQASTSLEIVRLYEGLLEENRVRQAVEESLRQSKAWLAAAQEISHTGSWRWNVPADEAEWSDEQYRILGLAPTLEPASLSILADRIHPDDRDWVLEDVKRALDEKLGFRHEFRIVRPDGEVRHVVGLGEPDASGRHGDFIGVIMDVTERKLAEDTVRTTQNDLAHAARLAMIGELAAAIIHEINQPLAATVVGAQAAIRWLGRAQPNLDEAKASMQEVAARARQASEIISGLRTLSRKGEANLIAVDLNATVDDVLPLLRYDLRNANVVLEVSLADGEVMVSGQRVQLQQVVVNLCRNAIEAMSEMQGRTRKLMVSTTSHDGEVIVSIRDTGPGIPADHTDRVFEPLFTTKEEGMGMGLAISRSIIDAHKGRLMLESSAAGTCFSIALPLLTSERCPSQA
ncbi:hypothetical protein BK022_18140 [Methylorubrum extorquens]|uniref:histidine kinase n=1 Tax=Methylorubrum extorquens TaxID=408 RepID=A0A1S1P4N0_METEX|nr:hypothetical protein BK022_18140 [Methylorubrum extorquens]